MKYIEEILEDYLINIYNVCYIVFSVIIFFFLNDDVILYKFVSLIDYLYF